MTTDQDVIELYRCVLGRAPEDANTVAAFKAYYPAFEAGRRAILGSEEFARLHAAEYGDAGLRLAVALLQRSGGQPQMTAGDDAVRDGMGKIMAAHGGVRLAVIAGEASPAGWVPGLAAQGCALHIPAAMAGAAPRAGRMESGATLLQAGLSPDGAASLLAGTGLAAQLVILPEDDAPWLGALRPCLAPQAALIGGETLRAADWPGLEAPLCLAGRTLRFHGGWFLPVQYVPAEAAPPDPSGPALAIAAIVRNEAICVGAMLRSAAPIAHSFVVVDTGSDDGTPALVEAVLRDLGKPYTVHAISSDRFDDMRNAALDLVHPAADWVLMLDADEELAAEDFAALQALLRDDDAEAYAMPRYNYQGAEKTGLVTPYPDRQVRLFRNYPDRRLRYVGAVHEKLQGARITTLHGDAQALGQGAGGPHIHHMVRRYRSPEAEAVKQDRYRDIAARYAA
jgi:hypothetical protein